MKALCWLSTLDVTLQCDRRSDYTGILLYMFTVLHAGIPSLGPILNRAWRAQPNGALTHKPSEEPLMSIATC